MKLGPVPNPQGTEPLVPTSLKYKLFDFRRADSNVEDGSSSKRWPRCPSQGAVQPAVYMDRAANQHTHSPRSSTWVSNGDTIGSFLLHVDGT